MAQKVLLADSIAAKINPLLENVVELQFFAAWFCVLGYTCQLYFDFAGYSNMAVGLGLLLGFSFPQNFDSPYKSASISEFWRRWHMTLSTWLRDYLFIPLGGSFQGNGRTLRNLVIVMFLGGLWHGADWTFVLWGLYHGALLTLSAILRDRWRRVPRWLGVITTFLAVLIGWVIFRSTDLGMCHAWLSAMAGSHGLEASMTVAVGGIVSLVLLAVLLVIIFCMPNVWQIRFKPNLVTAAALASILAVCVLRFSQESPFLYFQF